MIGDGSFDDLDSREFSGSDSRGSVTIRTRSLYYFPISDIIVSYPCRLIFLAIRRHYDIIFFSTHRFLPVAVLG